MSSGSGRRQQVLQSLEFRCVAGEKRLDGARHLVIVDERDVIAMWPVVREAYAGLELARWRRVFLVKDGMLAGNLLPPFLHFTAGSKRTGNPRSSGCSGRWGRDRVGIKRNESSPIARSALTNSYMSSLQRRRSAVKLMKQQGT